MQISKINQTQAFKGNLILYKDSKLHAIDIKDIKEIAQDNYPEYLNTTFIRDKNGEEYRVMGYTLSDVLLACNTANIHNLDIIFNIINYYKKPYMLL